MAGVRRAESRRGGAPAAARGHATVALDSAGATRRSCGMPSDLAAHLADRFASDGRALRARAGAVAGAPRRGPGPSADALRQMAAACDRIHALFVDADSDDAVRALLPTLGGLVAGARTEAERHVYAGAVSRVREALDGDGGGAGDEGDDDDDAGDDGAPGARQ